MAPEESATPPDDGAEARTARAREIFVVGVEHSQAQRWTEAVASFREALELRAAPAIFYNLAAALVELGEVREAHTALLAVEGDPAAPANLQELSSQLRQRMQVGYGRVRIELAEELDEADVALDGESLSAELLATEIPVSNGQHRVVATRDEETVARATVTTHAGQLTHVALSAAPVRVVEPVIEIVPVPSTPLIEEPALWVGVAAGVLVVAGVIIIAVVLTSGQSGTLVEGNFQPGLITWP